jgi:drug/metabolite transporter (DMT)-like permease
VIVGVAAILLAAVCYNLGILVEKSALSSLPALRVREPLTLFRSVFGRPRWLLGFALMLAGMGGQIVGLALLPITVAQPMLAAGPAVVVAGSAAVLGERLTRKDYLCLAVIGVSLGMLGLSFDPERERVGLGDHPLEVTAFCAASGLAAGVIYAAAYQASRARHAGPRGVTFGVAVGLLNGVGGLLGKACAAVVGSEGRQAPVRLLLSPYPYVFMLFAVVMLGAMQIALQRSRTANLVPAQVVVGNAHVMIAGMVIFGERLPSEPGRLALRLTGLAVSLAVLALRQRPGSPVVRTPTPTPAPAPGMPPVLAGVGELSPAEVEDSDGDRLVVDLVLDPVEADLDAVDTA